MKIKILLVENHKIFLDGLRVLFEKRPDMEIIGETDNGTDAVELALELKPDVVIMSMNHQKMNGIETTREIINKNPEIKVVFLSAHSEEKYVLEGISAGASGYLLKDCDFSELIQAIHAVVKNMHYICPQVASYFIEGFKNPKSISYHNKESILSNREREILQLIAEGNSSREIASILFLSERTVTSHRQNIMDKLGVHDIAMLTKYAIREGITSVEK